MAKIKKWQPLNASGTPEYSYPVTVAEAVYSTENSKTLAANIGKLADLKTLDKESLITALNSALALLAPEFDETKTYHYGDIILNSGKLYKLNSYSLAPAAFDVTKWTLVTDVVNTLQKQFLFLSENYNEGEVLVQASKFRFYSDLVDNAAVRMGVSDDDPQVFFAIDTDGSVKATYKGEEIATLADFTSVNTKLNTIESGAQVNTITGVKGSAESSYRTGNVSITATNVGLGNVTNESKSTMFTSPALTGTPTAPTAAASNNSTQIATTAYVTTAVAKETADREAAVTAEATARTSAITTAQTTLQGNIDDLEQQMQTEHASHLAATNATLTVFENKLNTQIAKELDDVAGLQEQITNGVATSGTITMVTTMDGITDYSADLETAPSRHAVQSWVNQEVSTLNDKINALLVAVGNTTEYDDFPI